MLLEGHGSDFRVKERVCGVLNPEILKEANNQLNNKVVNSLQPRNVKTPGEDAEFTAPNHP